jgi:hypothetical protein
MMQDRFCALAGLSRRPIGGARTGIQTDEPFGGWPRRMPRGRMRVDKFLRGVFSMLDLILTVCTIVIFYAFDRYTVGMERL